MAANVTNLRLGFATNSSSSHSVVLGAGSYSAGALEGEPSTFEFGWDDFELSDGIDKAAYLAAAVVASLDLPSYQVRPVVRELFAGTPLAERLDSAFGGWNGPYIDHQSSFTLPDPQRANFPAVVKEALEFFADQRVTVYGGNDNTDYDESPLRGPIKLGDDGTVVRIRRDGDNYVLFNFASGAKARFAPAGATYGKSNRPELVDLKITDACPYRCDFCYQGSTPAGKDGDSPRLSRIIDALGINGLGVFEVAIGGGEPTASEHFVSVINDCRENYIRPNFTTFAVDWLLDEEKVKAANLCGGIGVSVHSAKDLAKVEKISDRVRSAQVAGQHVYGTLPAKETIELIQAFNRAGKPLLLLGYKTAGFGASRKPHDMSDVTRRKGWPSLSEYDLNRIRLSVDTAFAQAHPEFLDFVKANKRTVSRTEGAFSMYVDGVTGKVGPSSYCDAAEMKDLPEGGPRFRDDGPDRQLVRALQSAFASYPGED